MLCRGELFQLILLGTPRLRGAKWFGIPRHSSPDSGHLAGMQGQEYKDPEMLRRDAETPGWNTRGWGCMRGGGMRGMQRFWDAWLGCPDFEMPGRDTTVQPLGLPGRGVGTRPARSRPRLNRAGSLRPLHAPAGPAGSGSSVLLLGRADTAPSSRREPLGSARLRTERGSPAPESGRNVTLECRHRSTPRVAPRLRWLPVWAGLARSC